MNGIKNRRTSRLVFLWKNRTVGIALIATLFFLAAMLAHNALERDLPGYARLAALSCAFVYGIYLITDLQQIFRLTIMRLERYAYLLDERDPSKALPDPFSENLKRWLSPEGYRVLLGATKKVEAKSASLLLVWSIMIAGALGFITARIGIEVITLDSVRWPIVMIMWTALATLPLLFCFRQLDTLDVPRNINASAQSMEEAMIWHLILKELGYRYSYNMMFATLGLLGLWLVLSFGEAPFFAKT